MIIYFCRQFRYRTKKGVLMLIESVLKLYLEYIRVTLSDGTYRFCLSHSNSLVVALNCLRISKIKELSRLKLQNLYDYWHNKNVSNSTINKRFGLLKRALNYSGYFIKGVSDFPTIKYKEKRFKIIPQDHIIKLIQYFNNLDDSVHGLTRKLIFYLLYYTGCRVSELIHIEIKNIDLVSCSIVLDYTKTGKPRVVFYDQFIDLILKKYIDLDSTRKYLFSDFRLGHDFTIHHVSAILRYACKKLNINRVTPHMFRHTFATMMIENGCPLVALQYILGHSRPQMTERYMHLGSSYLKKNYDSFKPKL